MRFDNITLATVAGPMTVQAVVAGVWAAHETVLSDMPTVTTWRVSHVPTGLTLDGKHGLLRLSTAVRIVERLAHAFPTLGSAAAFGQAIDAQHGEAADIWSVWIAAVDSCEPPEPDDADDGQVPRETIEAAHGRLLEGDDGAREVEL
jgi:hypothetical protein